MTEEEDEEFEEFDEAHTTLEDDAHPIRSAANLTRNLEVPVTAALALAFAMSPADCRAKRKP
jgi:hypothetical protein